MSLKRRIYTREFKQQVLRELDAGLPLAQVAREHAVSAKLLQRWHEEFAEYGEDAFAGNGRSEEAANMAAALAQRALTQANQYKMRKETQAGTYDLRALNVDASTLTNSETAYERED